MVRRGNPNGTAVFVGHPDDPPRSLGGYEGRGTQEFGGELVERVFVAADGRRRITMRFEVVPIFLGELRVAYAPRSW